MQPNSLITPYDQQSSLHITFLPIKVSLLTCFLVYCHGKKLINDYNVKKDRQQRVPPSSPHNNDGDCCCRWTVKVNPTRIKSRREKKRHRNTKTNGKKVWPKLAKNDPFVTKSSSMFISIEGEQNSHLNRILALYMKSAWDGFSMDTWRPH